MMNKFVIYGANRSGSHYLQSLLHSHPDINCYWDIFWGSGYTPHCLNTYLASRNLDRIPRFFGRKNIIFDFLNDHYARSADIGAAGFLLKWGAANRYPEILAWLSENDAGIVHIVRENFLVHWIAIQLRRTGMVKSHARSDIVYSKIKLDVEELLPQLRMAKANLEKERNKLKNHRVLEVKYESLLVHEDDEAAKIQDFLGVEKFQNLEPEFKKTESESPSEMIENYEEVYNLLRDSEFSSFLDGMPR
jgi:hypothetical protein